MFSFNRPGITKAVATIAAVLAAHISVVSLAPSASSQPISANEVQRGIVYTGQGRSPMKLDLYLPKGNDAALRPLVIYIHGGGFTSGDRTNLGAPLPWGTVESNANELNARGYAVASIDYGLAPANQWPAPLFHVKAAVRWLRANAANYRIDQDRFAAWGDSAGGYFATMLGVTGGVAELEGQDGTPGVSSRVQAVADWFGPSDFVTMQEQTVIGLPHDVGSPEHLYLGCAPSACRDTARTASPVTYADRDDAPVLIQHGALDHIVPIGQSVELAGVLTKAGVQHQFHTYQGADHEFAGFVDMRAIKQTFYEFLDSTLRRR
ncbi:alpha/beta hydrolase fold domain-containing protein [Nocardia sp. NPDC049149]|uniref:alpha/beta hydrolase fold domain-containing protein n=1 Tax=Nocardia sp. NPDC049149 TaxID=3364315 RepID=UPI0037100AC8